METQLKAKKDFICLDALKAQAWLDSRLWHGTSGALCHWLSCQTAIWYWFHPQDSSFQGQWHLQTTWSSSGPGGREPGRGILVVLACGCVPSRWWEGDREQSSLAHLTGQREDGTSWLIVLLRPGGVAKSCFPSEGTVLERQNKTATLNQCPLWISHQKWQSDWVLPLLFWFLRRWIGGFWLGGHWISFP